jgi:hypothetical protein
MASIFMPHASAEALIDERLDEARGAGRLHPSDAEWLDLHLASCERCRAVEESRKKLLQSMSALQGAKAPEGFAGRVMMAARARRREDRVESMKPMLPLSQLLMGSAMALVVVGALVAVVSISQKGDHGPIEGASPSLVRPADEKPNFIVRAPGIGAAKARSQITAIVDAHHGTILGSDGAAITARIPRGDLLSTTEDLARAGRYKMSKDTDVAPSADTILIRFELE